MKIKKNISSQRDQSTWLRGLDFKSVFPLFLVHMLVFGFLGFMMAYGGIGVSVGVLYVYGAMAILIYLVFYLVIFGLDKVKWMFINAALGLFGIYAQIDGILSLFDKSVADFPWYVHVIPIIYYVLYTFLLYQLVLYLTGASKNPQRQRLVEILYVVISIAVYGGLLLTSNN